MTTKAPAHVEHYLAGYSADDRAKIAQVLQSELNTILAKDLAARSEFIMSAGADGVGKSTLLQNFIAEALRQDPEVEANYKDYVYLDAGLLQDHLAGIKSSLPAEFADYAAFSEFGNIKGEKEDDESIVTRLEKMKADTEHWRRASLYLRDRLVYECMKRGLPIALETSAHGEHIDDFIGDIKTHPSRYRVKMLLADAPLSVKLAASEDRARNNKGYVSPADVVRKDIDLGKRMPLFPRLVDELAIYWRNHQSQALALVVASDGERFIFPSDAKAGKEREVQFNANRRGIDAYGLVAEHRQHCKLRLKGKTLGHYQPGARIMQLSDVH